MPVEEEPAVWAGLPGTSLTRLPRAAVLAAQDARLPASLLGEYLPTLASAAETGRRLAAELARFHGLGQAAAESGASLRALVDLYLSATWRAWPSLPAVRAAGSRNEAERTRTAAGAVLRASDDAVAAVCEGFEAARTARARAEGRCAVSWSTTCSPARPPNRAASSNGQAAFGLHLEAPHVVLVAAGERRFVDGRGTSRAVDAALRSTCVTEPMVAVKGGLLVCVVPQEVEPSTAPAGPGQADEAGASPGPGGAVPSGPGRGRSPFFTPLRAASGAASGAPRALAALTAALSAVAGAPAWQVGVSRPRIGVTGTRIGFAEA